MRPSGFGEFGYVLFGNACNHLAADTDQVAIGLTSTICLKAVGPLMATLRPRLGSHGGPKMAAENIPPLKLRVPSTTTLRISKSAHIVLGTSHRTTAGLYADISPLDFNFGPAGYSSALVAKDMWCPGYVTEKSFSFPFGNLAEGTLTSRSGYKKQKKERKQQFRLCLPHSRSIASPLAHPLYLDNRITPLPHTLH